MCGSEEEGLKIAYFHCLGGASGDMVLGALVDAGVRPDDLREALHGLKVTGWRLSSRPGQRGGLRGTSVSVELDEPDTEPRRWQDFVGIVAASGLSPRVIRECSAVFRRLAEAEARVHGVELDRVVLHELGSLDTLVDVVGSVVGLELLGVEAVYSSPLPGGPGLARGHHGPQPLPAPATVQLMAMANAPLVPPPGGAHDAGEMVTPTGAAILTCLATFRQPPMRLGAVGYGLGARESAHYPNALALWVGEELAPSRVTELSVIETNMDDISAEVLGYVQERLFALGAKDVWFTPIQMKKGRPGVTLSAIVEPRLESEAVALVLRETSTLGVRATRVDRYEADREVVEVETSLGRVPVKVKRLEGAAAAVSPEYEACRRIALDVGRPLQEVMWLVQREAEGKLLSPRAGGRGARPSS